MFFFDEGKTSREVSFSVILGQSNTQVFKT